MFNNLLTYNEGDSCYIGTILETLADHSNLYPVGCDPFGNYICLDLRRGGVVFYDHEEDGIIGIDVSSNPELFEGLLSELPA